MDLTDKTVFVTGGARGIGAACARSLLIRGAKVCIADLNDELGEALIKEFNETYGQGRALYVNCDVADSQRFEESFQKALSTFSNIDIMVNNAGIVDETNWKKMLDVNLAGTITGTELAIAHMRKDKGGQGGVVMNISSSLGFTPLSQIPVYVASKHGVIGYTRSLATAPDREKLGVSYACVCPDTVDTPLLKPSPSQIRDGYYEEFKEHIKGMGKMQPEKVAEAVLCVLDDQSCNDVIMAVPVIEGPVRKKMEVVNV